MNGLTVVVCTHNRSGLLQKLLRSLNEAHRPDELQIKLLVIANACTDDTENVLREYQLQQQGLFLPLEWVNELEIGKSHALNTALRRIDTDIAAFVDDDHRVHGQYFYEIKQSVLNYPETGLFCGRIVPDWDGKEPDWVHEHGSYRIYPLPVPNFDLGEEPCEVTANGRIPGGGNLFMRSKVLEKAGLFHDGLGPKGRGLGGSEDTDYVLRVLSLNIKACYMPDVIQYHYVDHDRLKMNYILRKSYQRSRSITRVRSEVTRVPAYLWKKVLIYIMKAIFSVNLSRTRFYLVRCMAAFGEISAIRDNRISPVR